MATIFKNDISSNTCQPSVLPANSTCRSFWYVSLQKGKLPTWGVIMTEIDLPGHVACWALCKAQRGTEIFTKGWFLPSVWPNLEWRILHFHIHFFNLLNYLYCHLTFQLRIMTKVNDKAIFLSNFISAMRICNTLNSVSSPMGDWRVFD